MDNDRDIEKGIDLLNLFSDQTRGVFVGVEKRHLIEWIHLGRVSDEVNLNSKTASLFKTKSFGIVEKDLNEPIFDKSMGNNLFLEDEENLSEATDKFF